MRLIILLLTLALSFAVSSAMTLEEYKKTKKDSITQIYIRGVHDGYLTANAKLTEEKKELLYCQLMFSRLTNTDLYSMIDKFIEKFELFSEKGGKDGKMVYETLMKVPNGVELSIFQSLQEKFPCK